MIDTSMYGRGGGFDSGLRMGQAIGGIFTGARDSGLREQALQRIQQGEDYNAVVQEVMQQSPQVAQELLNLRQQNMQAQSAEQNMQRTNQLIEIDGVKISQTKAQQAAAGLFGALFVDDQKAREKLIDENAPAFAPFGEGVVDGIKSIKNMPPEQQAQALANISKYARQIGLLPDDPSQLTQTQQDTVQSSRDVDGGTMITYRSGRQEFKPFGEDVYQAGEQARQNLPAKLTSAQESELLKLQQSANQSYSLAARTADLANRFSQINVQGGTPAQAREALIRIAGGEDGLSLLRREYTRIRNALIVEGLPQGPATDKDIQLIADGFLSATASPQAISEFLGAMSRAQEASAMFNEFQANFMQNGGSMVAARKEFDIDGFTVKKGERVRDAYKRYAKEVFGRQDEQMQPAQQPARRNFEAEYLGGGR